MNIVQISFLLGHEQLQTTMVYLDITLEQELKALATLEDEEDRTVSKKWKKWDRGPSGILWSEINEKVKKKPPPFHGAMAAIPAFCEKRWGFYLGWDNLGHGV